MNDREPGNELHQLRKELEQALSLRYTVIEHLKTNRAGALFKIKDDAEVIRVAKILRLHARNFPGLKEEFQTQAQNLSRLRHPNLVTMFEQSKAAGPPYFIMEFVSGLPLDLAMQRIAMRKPRGGWIFDLRRILLQLADVVGYLHSARPDPLLHLDIKPENIRLVFDYRKRPVPILLDLGISRYAEYQPEDQSDEIFALRPFSMWPRKYLDTVQRKTHSGRTLLKIDCGLLNVDLDLHLLGRTVREVIDEGMKKSQISQWEAAARGELRFLQELIQRLDIDDPTSPKIRSADELRTSLRRLEMRASRVRHHFNHGLVRIPGRNITSFGTNARALADWPRFQRLREIRQLGLTFLVYPGATHSRFEHSLGVFENALAVLDHLTGPQADLRFRSVVSDEELVATAIVALLHDIGHYPLAHNFRVHGKIPIHEKRTLKVLQSKEARKRIQSTFNRDVYNAALALMKSVVFNEEPGLKSATVQEVGHTGVLRRIISSAIDVDKLDYVSRDALHAGVPYGNVVDRDRFLVSLRIWWGKDGRPDLVLSDKGRVCAEALVFARYLMTSEVYWNHAVRAYAAMVSAALDLFEKNEIKAHLWDTDLGFLDWLTNDRRSAWLKDLIEKRSPYRRAFVHQRRGGRTAYEETDRRLFEFLEKAAGSGRSSLRQIQSVVARALKINRWQPYEIVLDVPAGVSRIGGVHVLPEGLEEPGSVGPIFDAIGANFDDFARKARIFVHPRHMEGLSVAEGTKIVRDTLIKAFGFT